MPETVNDLPNPLDPAAPTNKSADDLVAQLAEKAIDQMLSEKEIERPEKTVAAVADNMQAQLDSLLSEVTADFPNPSSAPVAPAATPATATATATATASSSTDSASPLASLDAAWAAPIEAAVDAPPSAPTGRLNQGEIDDLMANFTPPPPEPEIAKAQSDMQALLHDIEPTAGQSSGVLVMLLEWVNKPFDFISPHTRLVLGRVAILTLINALAVLGYVIYLRWK